MTTAVSRAGTHESADPRSFDPPTIADPTHVSHWTPDAVRWGVLTVAVVAGLAATIGGPEPTGSPGPDVIIVAVAVGVVTWLGAAAMRWDVAIASIVAGLASWTIPGAVLGVVNAIVGYAIPDRRGFKSVITAAMAGITMNIACRSGLDGFLGASAIVGLATGAAISLLGLKRRTAATRRAFGIGALFVLAIVVIAVLGLLYGGWAASNDLRDANSETRQALDQLGDGDVGMAKESFGEAADAFDRAEQSLSNPVAQLSRFVPIVAQHRTAAVELSRAGNSASQAIAEQLDLVDLDALTVVDGRIDIDVIRAIEAPLVAIQSSIEQLDATITDVQSPWLIAPARHRIDELASDITDQRQRGDDALAVARAAPSLLGGDGRRVYFIAFTTPAEARGIGGFMGNWAEITVDNGSISLTRFGRTDDLDSAAAPGTRFITGPADWIKRYGNYQLTNGDDGSTGESPWKNVTMSPRMASTGQVIAELYPQSGGQPIDGVFVIDVYALARFLDFTGPIALSADGPTDGGDLTSDNAVSYLLNGQYAQTDLGERVDVLETFSRTVLDRLLAGSLPPPTDVVDVLGPMVDQGRLSAYTVRDDEQDVLRQIGLSGTLPELGTDIGTGIDDVDATHSGDALAIAFNNAAGNKIDFYLSAHAHYSLIADGTTNSAAATLELVLNNGAPTEGQPGYVIGNPIDLPVGENRTYVSIFTRLPVTELLLDGKRIDAEPGFEAGYFVTSAFVQIPAGGEANLSLAMSGPLDLTDGYVLDARSPPTVAPTPIDVDVTYRSIDADGDMSSQSTTATQRGPGTLRVTIAKP